MPEVRAFTEDDFCSIMAVKSKETSPTASMSYMKQRRREIKRQVIMDRSGTTFDSTLCKICLSHVKQMRIVE